MQVVQVGKALCNMVFMVANGRVVAIGGVSIPRAHTKLETCRPGAPMPLADACAVGCPPGLPRQTAQISQNLLAVCEPWACLRPWAPGRIVQTLIAYTWQASVSHQQLVVAASNVWPETDHQMQTPAWPQVAQTGGHV